MSEDKERQLPSSRTTLHDFHSTAFRKSGSRETVLQLAVKFYFHPSVDATRWDGHLMRYGNSIMDVASSYDVQKKIAPSFLDADRMKGHGDENSRRFQCDFSNDVAI